MLTPSTLPPDVSPLLQRALDHVAATFSLASTAPLQSLATVYARLRHLLGAPPGPPPNVTDAARVTCEVLADIEHVRGMEGRGTGEMD